MPFGLFHKGQFKGLWHNQKSDKDWVALTCKALAMSPYDVEVLYYDYPFNPRTVYIFDEKKDLLIQGQTTKTVEINGEIKEVEAWETIERWPGEPYFKDGQLV